MANIKIINVLITIAILSVLISVSASVQTCNRATSLAEKGIKNNFGVGDNYFQTKLAVEEIDSLGLLPEKLKSNLGKAIIDINPGRIDVNYLDKEGKALGLLRATIKEKDGTKIVNLQDIALGKEYRGGAGKEFFNNFIEKIPNPNDENIIVYGKAASSSVANYWAYQGAKFNVDSYRVVINNKLVVALKDNSGVYKYFDAATNSEKILKDTKNWNFIKGEAPKGISLPETSTFWFER